MISDVDRDKGSFGWVDQREIHGGELDIALVAETNEDHSLFQPDGVARKESEYLFLSQLEGDVLFLVP
jgi:hypothetical protein